MFYCQHAAAAAGKSLQLCLTLCNPRDWQPTRLPRPWEYLGKNTGAGCHCLLQCMKVKSESELAQLCPTLSDPMDCSLPWDFSGKSTGVGCKKYCYTLPNQRECWIEDIR